MKPPALLRHLSKGMRSLALLAAAVLILSCTRAAESATSKSAHPRTVVLELFTSQGCSSCPPADTLLSKLRREDFDGATVIPLAYHVDYWNHLGWRDPFSSRQWSNRQRAYAQAMRSAQVYTPQIVINGKTQLVGSAESAIRAEIDRQLKGDDAGTIAIERVTRAGNALKVDLQSTKNANAVIVLFENGITTNVESGENEDRRLTNDAIVRWQGSAPAGTVTIPLDPSWRTQNLGLAAFLQDGKSMNIYASTRWKSPVGN